MNTALLIVGILTILFASIGGWAWWNARGTGDGGMGLGIIFAGASALAVALGITEIVLIIVKLSR